MDTRRAGAVGRWTKITIAMCVTTHHRCMIV
jgi:hypothetical protein